MKKKLFNFITVISATFLLVGCTNNTSSKEPRTDDMTHMPTNTANIPTGDAPNTVKIVNYVYIPNKITIKKGQNVTFINFDPTRHDINFDNDEYPDGKLFDEGETYIMQNINKVGVFPYHCTPHPFMTGILEVIE